MDVETVVSEMREELLNTMNDKLESQSTTMFNEMEEIKKTTENLQNTMVNH